MYKLLIISFSRIASDARVLKQVHRFLADYEVHTASYGPAVDGVAGHTQIPDEYAIWQYDKLAVVSRQYRRAYWSNRAITYARTRLERTGWDLIIANDIDAVGLAVSLKPTQGVLADLHEFAPRQKDDVPRWKLFIAPFMRWMCRTYLTQASAVTTVGEGIAAAYHEDYGVSAQVVTNAAPHQALVPTPVSSPLRLVHSGAALRDRHIGTIVDAVERCAADIHLDLYLTPNDPDFLAEIRARADGSGRISVHDPVPYAQLAETLNACDVGVHLLPPVNFNNKWALPNKLFDYVQARLAVIIGPSPEMQRVLDAHGFGVVTTGFAAQDLCDVLDGLTVSEVTSWKVAADNAADRLSAEEQIEVWVKALHGITERAPEK